MSLLLLFPIQPNTVHSGAFTFTIDTTFTLTAARRRFLRSAPPRPNWVNEKPGDQAFGTWADRIRPAVMEDHNRIMQYIESIRSHESKILEGMTVTALSPTSYKVRAGSYVLDGNYFNFDALTVTIASADATYDRIDAIYANDQGIVFVQAGVPAAAVLEPIPGDSPVLKVALIYVPKTGTPVVGPTTTKELVQRTFVLGRGSNIAVGTNLTNEVCPIRNATLVAIKGQAKVPGAGNLVLDIFLDRVSITPSKFTLTANSSASTTLVISRVALATQKLSIDVFGVLGAWQDVTVDVLMELNN